jgi:hypothetical protein
MAEVFIYIFCKEVFFFSNAGWRCGEISSSVAGSKL